MIKSLPCSALGAGLIPAQAVMGFPGGSNGKGSACNAGDLGSIPGLGRSLGEGNGNLTIFQLSGKSHGRRSLAGYSLWGRKELDTTEQLQSLSFF